jgi:signal transduction histidine kinase
LKPFKRFISGVPPWAFVPVLIVIFVQIANIIQTGHWPVPSERADKIHGYWIINYIDPRGPADKAGIEVGDTVISCNSYTPDKVWFYEYNDQHEIEAGDTLIYSLLRNNQEIAITVVLTSRLSMYPGIYWSSFIFFILVSIGSLYILFKKPKDKAVVLYFLYIQGYALLAIGMFIPMPDPISLIVSFTFLFCGAMHPAILIHFHLVFPKPAKYFSQFKKLPLQFYSGGLLIFVFEAVCIVYPMYFGTINELFLVNYDYIGLLWATVCAFLALGLAIFQFATIKDTLCRNQLRIIVIGTFFGVSSTICYTLFYNDINQLWWYIYPNLFPFMMKSGSLVLTCCILIAIFHYRIWNIEVILRKAILYLSATIIIIISYLLLLFLVDYFTIDETKVTRFVILAISVIIFLVLRDWLQRLIERIFHREAYDTSTVVSDFEEKLAGVYRIEDLGLRIVKGLDEIFHFRSVMLNLKKEGMIYQPEYIQGLDDRIIQKEIEINNEFENKLARSKVFSPGELNKKLPVFEAINGELIVPLIKDDRPYGFFICGPKKSEKIYSMQDIRVLSLIAKRVIALYHTASLYQKDLDRQLILEQERARISQDMHDDIGAGLTKIAMMSEAKTPGQDKESNERLLRAAATARDMINRLNVIVWALNPKYDNLESLVSYIRRYFGEYLENFGIGFRMEVPDDIPDLAVTPDLRRNAFYAWQEAIHNAIKHSACSEIQFVLKISGQTLMVAISDNGKGFEDTKASSGGNGLLNMKKRAEDMGGLLEIQSTRGNGTRVLFTISL